MTISRVAYVLNVFPKLSETFIAGELAELARRGVETLILTLRGGEEPHHGIVERAGLLERTVSDPDDFLPALRRFRPELLHAHYAREPAAAARKLAAACGLPFTFTAHGYDVYRRPPPDWPARAAAAAAVVTVSEANARHLEATFGVPRQHLHVIPCGVDTEQFRPRPEREDPPVVLCVARLRPVKNLESLLEACARLRQSHVPFRCVVVGEGPSRPELEALVEQLALADAVCLRGAADQDEVARWWGRASVGVLSSRSEAMPVSLMEAGASGLPVVAPAVGGIPELVVDGVTGLVVPPGDPDALAGGLRRLLVDRRLRERMGEAARRRIESGFSVVGQVDRLLSVWEGVLAVGPTRRSGGVLVEDPFGVGQDRVMPELALALDPDEAARQLGARVPRLAHRGEVRLTAIRVLRYKPERRCLVEYELEDGQGQPRAVLGKVRGRRYGKSGSRLLQALWDAGFHEDSPDGISVPEPLGTVPAFRMWLQRKVPGVPASSLLADPRAETLARRVAEAAAKLHRAGVATEARHSMADELRILHECLPSVAAVDARWERRLDGVLSACDRLGQGLPGLKAVGIHRDFYPDQVLVDGDRLHLVDFDLYCLGDPALDIGNYIGHLTEHALRTTADPDALVGAERALEDRFVELSGEHTRPGVHAYSLLTLVRHVYLSTRFPDRRHTTAALLDLCEVRLSGG